MLEYFLTQVFERDLFPNAHALVLMHKHMLAAQANPYSDAFLCIQYSNLGWHPTLERMMGEL